MRSHVEQKPKRKIAMLRECDYNLKNIFTSLFHVDANETWGNWSDIRYRHITRCLQEKDTNEPYNIWKGVDFSESKNATTFDERLPNVSSTPQSSTRNRNRKAKPRSLTDLSTDLDQAPSLSVRAKLPTRKKQEEQEPAGLVHRAAFATTEGSDGPSRDRNLSFWRKSHPSFVPVKDVQMSSVPSLTVECPETEFQYSAVKRRMIEVMEPKRKAVLNSLMADWEAEVNTYELLIYLAEEHFGAKKVMRKVWESYRNSESVVKKCYILEFNRALHYFVQPFS